MKSISIIIIAGLLLTTCIPSLQPLFIEEELITSTQLPGVWTENQDDVWIFERGAGKSYRLTQQSDNHSAKFKARPGNIGSHTFLETFPEDIGAEHDFLEMHLVPAYIFMKIDIADDKLVLTPFSPEWFDKKVKAGVIDLDYQIVDQLPVLIAPTAELQNLVKKYAGDPEAFGEPLYLERIE